MASQPTYTAEVGRKFTADGAPALFAGNTIICFVDPHGELGRAAAAFQREIQAQPFGGKFAMLPPPSFHMTVMELLCDRVRLPERWSALLPLDAALPETDAFFIERVPSVPLPAKRSVGVAGVYHGDNILLALQPTPDSERELRAYRDALAEATGVRAPDHAGYRFHMSLAYRIQSLAPAEDAALDALCAAWLPRLRQAGAAVELPPPTLTFFEDMFRFVPAGERHTLRCH